MRIGDDLTTVGLDRILEHEAGDLTCTVEAGVRLSTLNRELARRGQRLSLDPPGDPTIGAVLARNVSGPLRHRFGAPRDLVLGVTLVLADGTIASAGGKVVKNVAGYDLARLVCGSEGKLALIGRASFRLHPLPKASRTLVVEAERRGDLARLVAGLLRSQLEPSALDLLHPGRLGLLFEGSPGAVGAQIEEAEWLVRPGGLVTISHEATDQANHRADPVHTSEGNLVTISHKESVWDESRRRQGAARGRVRFAPGDLAAALPSITEAVVRPVAGVAYLPVTASDDTAPAVRRLEDAIRVQLDPRGVLVA
jgi:glycolate oxidase FAD binding subunit